MPSYWVALRLRHWEGAFEPLGVNWPPGNVTVSAGEMVGFLPVYTSREAALADYPDGPVMEIKEIDDKGDAE